MAIERKLFTDTRIAIFEEASKHYYSGYRDRLLPTISPKISYWKPEHGELQRYNEYVQYEVNAFRQVLTKPLLGVIAATLAGAPTIRLFQSTLLRKPPKHASFYPHRALAF